MALTVARHCVPIGPGGLSPLQAALADDPHPVRIASAPTGAGKSFVFQRLMVERGQRVLFFVPTRRLAANLANGLIEALTADHGWNHDRAEAKVALWSGEETARLRERGVTEVGPLRLRQVDALAPAREGGEMVIAIPEAVSHLLIGRRPTPGLADVGALHVLFGFNHIVFDEFHNIEPRGFGLAALLAGLAAAYDAHGAARVSLLSATPLDLMPVLHRLRIGPAAVARLREATGDEGRAIHGDVRLEFSAAPSLAEEVIAEMAVVRAEAAAGRQVVVIYDRLRDLEAQRAALEAAVAAAGMRPEEAGLVISSADDRRQGPREPGRFASGRGHRPEDFALIVATSSVEMGVNLRADLMFMEPGFEPMNFLQRYGRAARGDRAGRVVVHHDERSRAQPWLRRLLAWATEHDGARVTIHELTTVLTTEVAARFALEQAGRNALDDVGEDGTPDPHAFGALPVSAAFTAGLYWHVLLQHPSNDAHRRRHLEAAKPGTAGLIAAWLAEVRRLGEDRRYRHAAGTWCDAIEREAERLRDIGEAVVVHEGDGGTRPFPLHFLKSASTIFDRYPIGVGPDGTLEVTIEGKVADYLGEPARQAEGMLSATFPHTDYRTRVPVGRRGIEAWAAELRRPRSPLARRAVREHSRAIDAAERLVRATGLLVTDDTVGLAAPSGIL